MACVEFENLVLHYLEKQLSPEAQSRVAAHLAQCAVCREFARQLEQLDAQLTRGVKTPALPPDPSMKRGWRGSGIFPCRPAGCGKDWASLPPSLSLVCSDGFWPWC
jgi:hypothetical protein